MRVLVVSSYPPRPCGIGAYARDQVGLLRREGHAVTVLSPPDGDGDRRVPFQGGRPFVLAARLCGRFDRVVVHFQPALYYRPRAPASKVATSLALVGLAIRCRRLDIVVHEADDPVRWRPDYVLLALAFRLAARLSFHTRREWDALERAYRVRVRGMLIEHRVEAVAPGEARERARRALGIPERETVFLCAGFLQPSKGFDRVIRAFEGEGEGVLYVVGSVRGRTRENEEYAMMLRRLASGLPRVRLVERFVDDGEFDRWIAAADRVVLPYRRSWSSGVLARARALGTPAIVSDVGGLAEQAGPEDVVVAGDDELQAAVRDAVASRGRRRAAR